MVGALQGWEGALQGWKGALQGWEGTPPGCYLRQGVTFAGGTAGPLARVGTRCRWAGQPLAGHGTVQAEAAAAGVTRRGEVLLVARGDQALGQRTAGGRG